MIGSLGFFATLSCFFVCLTLLPLLAFARGSGKLIKIGYYTHLLLLTCAIFVLLYLISSHQFQYMYVWSHSSHSLPIEYLLASLWEGQEGSFLIWIFFNGALGLFILHSQKFNPKSLMIILGIQGMLLSMILGIDLLGIKIGSSPFALLKDSLDAPIFKTNPNFKPDDGTGLNPLLQNYWMVIHPPVLFLGFAATIIPFAYCFGGLISKDFRTWIKPCLRWTIFATAILGAGIIMGGFWAYETLSFGGFWNWDPVENAVYVPWLLLVASIHMLMISHKNLEALKYSIGFVASSFISIMYSTFLTRSGILGNSSVHSFVDLGLSGQLVFVLVILILFTIGVTLTRGKLITQSKKRSPWLRSHTFIGLGVLVLSLMSFQVLLATSIPVINALGESLGISLNLAPPTNPNAFYSGFQIWFAIAVIILSAIAQLFWRKRRREKRSNSAINSLIISLVSVSIIVYVGGVKDISHILLLLACASLISLNLTFIWDFIRTRLKLSPGVIVHFGFGFMMIGILISAYYAEVVTNTPSFFLHEDPDNEMNRDNVVLFIGDSVKVGDYTFIYSGRKVKIHGSNEYIDHSQITPFDNYPYMGVLSQDLNKYQKGGDTVKFFHENTYFQIECLLNDRTFQIYPKVQDNPRFGIVTSPSIEKGVLSDFYAHVTYAAEDNFESKRWLDPLYFDFKENQHFIINNYKVLLGKIDSINNDFRFKVIDGEKNYIVQTSINDNINNDGYISELGLQISPMSYDPENGLVNVEIKASNEDYIVLKAQVKPQINLVWSGCIIMFIGLMYSFFSKGRWIKKRFSPH